MLLGLVVRLPGLHESLWYDELFATRLKLGNVLLLGHQLLYDVHPPAYVGSMYLWIKLFGDSEIAIRMPALIAGCLSIGLLYAIGRRLMSRSVARLAAILMALSPVHIWYSQEARQYSPALCLLLLAILAYYELQNPRPARRWLVLYTVAMFAAVFSHYFIAIYPASIAALCLLKPIDRSSRQLMVINTAIVLSMLAFVGAKQLVGDVPTSLYYLRSFTPTEAWRLFFDWFLLGSSYPLGDPLVRMLVVSVRLIFLGFLAAGLWRIIADSRRNGSDDWLAIGLFLFGLPAALWILSLAGLDHFYIERSALVLLPFFLLALASGIAGGASGARRAAFSTFALVVATTTLVTFHLHSDTWTVYRPNPDWRSAAAYLDPDRREPADGEAALPSIAFTTGRATVLNYYDRNIGEEATSLAGKATAKFDQLERSLGRDNVVVRWVSPRLRLALADLTRETRLDLLEVDDARTIYEALAVRGGRSFYLVHNRYRALRPPERQEHFEALLAELKSDPRLSLLRSRRFDGLEIYTFALSDTASVADSSTAARRLVP